MADQPEEHVIGEGEHHDVIIPLAIRTLKEEHGDYSYYRDFDDAFEDLAHWLEIEYMTERIHSSLGYLTPTEFEAAYFVNQSDSLLEQA